RARARRPAARRCSGLRRLARPGEPRSRRGSLRRRLALVEGLDHLVGDVDARAVIDDILEDDVELFLLGDLAYHAVCVLDHLGELLVAALVQVLAELALFPLELAVQVAELALPGAPLRLAHRDAVLLEVFLHALQLV